MALLLILLALFGFVLGGGAESSTSTSATSSKSETRIVVRSSVHTRSVVKRCRGVRIIKGASSQKPLCMYRPVSP